MCDFFFVCFSFWMSLSDIYLFRGTVFFFFFFFTLTFWPSLMYSYFIFNYLAIFLTFLKPHLLSLGFPKPLPIFFSLITGVFLIFDYLNRCRESLWQNATSIYEKNPPESRHRRNIPQHNKSYIWQTHNKHYRQWWKIESISPKIRNKTRVPTLTTTIQHSFRSFCHSHQSRKRNKRNPDRKIRSKTLIVCRW